MRLHLAAALVITALSPALFAPAKAQTVVTISVQQAPPPLPLYVQPPCPQPNYLWAPGYWAWDGFDYYWVPGSWVLPPTVGLLWTPGYWGWHETVYVYNSGYWGRHVGFYGGVVYGFGYTGFGYEGGYWNNDAFFYNRTVTNITNVRIINVYNKTVVNAHHGTVSYNGGKGGVAAAPTPEQLTAAQEAHIKPTENQLAIEQTAHKNPKAFVKVNKGSPPVKVIKASKIIAQPAPSPKAESVPRIKQSTKVQKPAQDQLPKPIHLTVKPHTVAPLAHTVAPRAQSPKAIPRPHAQGALHQPRVRPQVAQRPRPAAPRAPRRPRCPPGAKCH